MGPLPGIKWDPSLGQTGLSLFNSTVRSLFCPVCPWDGWGFVPGTIVPQGPSRKCLCVFCLLVFSSQLQAGKIKIPFHYTCCHAETQCNMVRAVAMLQASSWQHGAEGIVCGFLHLSLIFVDKVPRKILQTWTIPGKSSKLHTPKLPHTFQNCLRTSRANR